MATLNLEDDELKALEQTLSKVAQLSSSVQSFRQDLLKSNPLPPPKSIQASAKILQKNLRSLLESTNENADLFNRMAIHPSTNYPGRVHENVLLQLLRKKLEPDVEELVSQGLETSRLATPAGLESLENIWKELRAWLSDRVGYFAANENNDPYTAEERANGTENVRTGLRKGIEDDEDDEDEDEEETEQAAAPVQVRGPEPETLLWFAARGDFEVPRNVEYERKEDAFRGIYVYKGLQGVGIPFTAQSSPQLQQDSTPL
ncbi:mediator of rna polymerase ii transcription subunit 8 [Fusarium longipes]|uniref:Mediator of RNA polymerase II transcription subunit 8 n=1 Tax=Fusarium longipes TaxID=694270 RepID=A0A395T607_9HYPO|nr:mediator of rna polymerase ii transcription subunit 8 [Fusarium longipes]